MQEAVDRPTDTSPVFFRPFSCSISSRARLKFGLHRFKRRRTKARPHRREPNALGVTLKQRDAQFVFDLPDASGQRGLSDAEVSAGGAQTPHLSHSQNVAKMREFSSVQPYSWLPGECLKVRSTDA